MSSIVSEAQAIAPQDRRLILTGVLLALFLAALDQTIVSTALPRIVQDLEGVSRYAWVATAYLLASTALVPIYGKLADTYPRKYVELGAVILFLSGSVLCGLSGEFGSLPLIGDGMNQLILFRAVQGAGGAGLIAMTFIVIADLFPPAQRGRYQGLVGGTWGIASVLGPLLGGILTDHAGGVIPGVEGWRWVFYVNLPLGAVALWFLVRRMPPLEPLGDHPAPDLLSAALLLGGLTPLVLALQLDKTRFPWFPGAVPGLGSEAWQAWVTPVLFLVAVILLGAFIQRSRRARSPILDLTLFRDAVFRRANAAAFFFGGAFMSIVIFLPLFLVNVVGVSATRAGMALVPFSMGLVFGSTFAGQLASRIGHLRDQILVGGAILFVAVVLLARMTPDARYGMVTLYTVLCGLGFGPTLPLFTLAIQNSVDVRRVGQATSAAQFFRQIGGTVGAALMGTVLSTTLILSFASMDLPPELEADPEYAPTRLASTGARGLAERVRAVYIERGAGTGAAAARSGEESAAAANRGAAANPGETARVRAEAEAERVRAEVRAAFTRATTRVYLLTAWLVAVAWLLSWRLPERPLRTTHDREVLAT
ncbi:MAG: MDR family MFS transporter [Gemmatimonadota bacterium]